MDGFSNAETEVGRATRRSSVVTFALLLLALKMRSIFALLLNNSPDFTYQILQKVIFSIAAIPTGQDMPFSVKKLRKDR